MKLISVNIGSAQPIGGPGTAKFYPCKTGIYKHAVKGPVFVGTLGVANDVVCNTKFHGGVDQAVYIYSVEDYAHFQEQSPEPLSKGHFGENFTVEGLVSAEANVGDRYQFGKLILEVTSPRIPCTVFSARMNDKNFVKLFFKAKRPGVYCRVITQGSVEEGMDVAIQLYQGGLVPLQELFEAYPYKKISNEQRVRFLSAPLHWKARAFLNHERESPS